MYSSPGQVSVPIPGLLYIMQPHTCMQSSRMYSAVNSGACMSLENRGILRVTAPRVNVHGIAWDGMHSVHKALRDMRDACGLPL